MRIDLETLAFPSSAYDLQPPQASPGPLVVAALGTPIAEHEELAAAVSFNTPANTGTVGDPYFQDEVHVAAFGQRVLAAFNDSRGAGVPRRVTGWSFSTNGGSTWAPSQLLPVVPGLADNRGDPVLAAFDERRWLLACLATEAQTGQSVIAVYRSFDGGQNFGQASIASLNHSAQSFMDKEWMAVDNRANSKFRGSVYVTFTNFLLGRSIIQLAFSRDLGVTFSPPITLSANQPDTRTQFSQVAVGQNGEVFATFWWGGDGEHGPGHYFVKSTDGGASFSAPQRILPTTKPGQFNFTSSRFELNGFIRVAEIATLAVDPASGGNGGDLHFVATSHGQGNDQADVLYVRSLDGGNTWSGPIRLNDDNAQADQFFPAIAVGEPGILCASWYDRRNDPGNLRLEVFGRISQDRGNTWEDAFEISDITPGFLPQTGPGSNYMGDYTGSAWAENHFVIGWGDNRSGIRDDAFTAMVTV